MLKHIARLGAACQQPSSPTREVGTAGSLAEGVSGVDMLPVNPLVLVLAAAGGAMAYTLKQKLYCIMVDQLHVVSCKVACEDGPLPLVQRQLVKQHV